MKIRYLLSAGALTFTLAIMPCSFVHAEDGQNIEIQNSESLIIDTNEQEEKIITESIETIKNAEEQLKNSQIPMEDLRYMSAIIFAEAGNQCEAGQQAVGIVVMNRVKSDLCKNTVHDVIYESGQFSPVKSGSFSEALSLYDNEDLPNEVIESAKYALLGNTTVYYNETTYNLDDYLYFNGYVSGCRLQIQDHMFK